MHRRHLWAGSTIVVIVLALAAWLALSPGWAVQLLQEQVRNQLGRKFEARGGVSLELSPRLAIRLDRASLGGPAGQDGSFITARAVRIPIGFWQLITRSPDLSAIELDRPEFAFVIDERGIASWSFAAVKTPAPLSFTVENGSLRFFDAHTSQSFLLTNIRSSVDIGADGDVTVKGTANMGGRLAKIDAYVKSLARVHEDGSPLDLSVETAEISATFSGRVATANALNLAGAVAVRCSGLRAAARWAGVDVGEGNGYGDFTISGALDSAGRAFAVHKADIRLDDAVMKGEVVVDLRGAVPKLQAALLADTLALDPFLPDSGRSSGQWGTAALGFETLKGFDAEVTLDAAGLGIGPVAPGPGRIVITLAKHVLKASVVLRSFASGSLKADVSVDSSAIPPAVSASVKAEAIDVGALLPHLTGRADLDATLEATGRTELELVGTLKGTASVSLADGAIKGPDLTAMLASVSQRILEGWTDRISGTTAFATLTSGFDVADGIATLKDANLENPALKVTASGDVDLLRRALDLKADPRLVTGEGQTAGFPVSIIVRGPWEGPRIYPDLPDVLANPKSAFTKLKAMGLPASD